MKLHRTAEGCWVGLKSKRGKGGKSVEVPTKKADLIDFLNSLSSAAAPKQSYFYQHGWADAERGMTANPYGTPEARAEWDRGHDAAVEAGAGKLRRFGLLERPSRFASRPARKRAKPATKLKQKGCTTARCRANRNRPKGMLG